MALVPPSSRGASVTLPVSVANGGTGATTQQAAQAALGVSGTQDETAWELVWDTGSGGTNTKACLARMRYTSTAAIYDDLYYIDGYASSNHYGLWRFRSGVWTQVKTTPYTNPNFAFAYGNTAFKGTLVGGGTNGNVYKTVFNTDGTWNAYTLIYTATAQVQDTFISPVFAGKLYAGTFSNATYAARLYSWDDTTFSLVNDFTSAFGGTHQSTLTDFTICKGLLWFTVTDNTSNVQWLCCMDEAQNITVVWKGVISSGVGVSCGGVSGYGGGLTTWRGELVANMQNSTQSQICSFNGAGWTPIASAVTGNAADGFLLPVGDTLISLTSYSGVMFLADTGALTSVANSGGWAGGTGVIQDARVHAGYLWVVTAQATQLWRLAIGTDHIALTVDKPQTQAGGWKGVLLVDVNSAPATASPVSGTAFQCSTVSESRLTVSVTLSPAAGAAATCVLQISPDNTTFYTLGTETAPAGVALDGFVRLMTCLVPQSWYVKLTATNATLGTATYY